MVSKPVPESANLMNWNKFSFMISDFVIWWCGISIKHRTSLQGSFDLIILIVDSMHSFSTDWKKKVDGRNHSIVTFAEVMMMMMIEKEIQHVNFGRIRSSLCSCDEWWEKISSIYQRRCKIASEEIKSCWIICTKTSEFSSLNWSNRINNIRWLVGLCEKISALRYYCPRSCDGNALFMDLFTSLWSSNFTKNVTK